MNKRITANFIKFALMLALLGAWSIPDLASAVPQIPTGPKSLGTDAPNASLDPTPDYYTTANWANSPPINKFVDTLPGLGAGKANNLGQYLPVAVADQATYPGSDYYVIGVVEYTEKMHSELEPTTMRAYVQLNDDGANGKDYTYKNGVPPHYLGPVIVAQGRVHGIANTLPTDPGYPRPVRVKFYNLLPAGAGGDSLCDRPGQTQGAGRHRTRWPGWFRPLLARRTAGTPCSQTGA